MGVKTFATVTSIKKGGIIVEFFSHVRAFIPRGEISEAYIANPKDHFQLGQTVNVRITEVDSNEQRMTATCRTYQNASEKAVEAIKEIIPGKSVCSGTVVEKTSDSIILDIQPDDLRGILHYGHISDDTSLEKKKSLFKKVEVGQTLENLLVLEKNEKKQLVTVSAKPALLKTAKELGDSTGLPGDITQVHTDQRLYGFISNVTESGVFVTFANKLTALAPKGELFNTNTFVSDPTQFFKKYSSVLCTVVKVDPESGRFNVSFKDSMANQLNDDGSEIKTDRPAVNPVDSSIKRLSDYKIGRLTKARVIVITPTHVNLEFADNQLGRIDISEVYDSFDEIENPLKPLEQFQDGQIISVRVIGTFNAKSAKALAITRPDAVTTVLECSCKPSLVNDSRKVIKLTPESEMDDSKILSKYTVGSVHTAFVHHLEDDLVFVNITPKMTGNVSVVDLSDQLEDVVNFKEKFPEGSALRVSVLKVNDPKKSKKEAVKNDSNDVKESINSNKWRNSLVLTTRVTAPLMNQVEESLVGMITPGEVIKKSTRKLIVRISGVLVATLHYTDIMDDYSMLSKKVESLEIGSIIPVKIIDVDTSNNKVFVSSRTSLVNPDSKKNVINKFVGSFADLEPKQKVEGFVSNISDHGVFVELGHSVVARVQIKNVSDDFLADWKKGLKVGQKVSGVILSVNLAKKKADLSLKKSHLAGEGLDTVTGLSFSEIKVGSIMEGKVKKIFNYGVFISLKGTNNIDGLCHISEIADTPVEDIERLFDIGDKVKVKILDKDEKKKKLSLGLKASYFNEEDSDEDDENEDSNDINMVDSGNDEEGDDNDDDDDEEEEEENFITVKSDFKEDESSESEDEDIDPASVQGLALGSGLSVGFDWTGSILEQDEKASDASDSEAASENEEDHELRSKSKRRKNRTKINLEDKTAELATSAPQSVTDYERLLVANPNSSVVWMGFMAFQLQLGELDKAREIAERALKTISFRHEEEKLNIWVALLNLETNFGTPESVQKTFKESLQFMDSKTIYLKMASIYQAAGNIAAASKTFDECCKKFAREDLSLWAAYGEMLYKEASEEHNKTHHTETERAKFLEQARAVLEKAQKVATQLIKDKFLTAKRAYADLVAKFIKFEYQYGEIERGRNLFENLLSTYKKRIDLWAVFIDYEVKYNVDRFVKKHSSNSKEYKIKLQQNKKVVEDLFERLVGNKKTEVRISMKQAKFFFKKWLAFETKYGDSKSVDYVKGKAGEYVAAHAPKKVEESDDDEDEEEEDDESSEEDDEIDLD